MSELVRTVGADIIVKIPKGWPGPLAPEGGFDEYKIPAARIEEHAVIEAHILKHRVDPLSAILPQLERLGKMNDRHARKLAKDLSERAYNDLRKEGREIDRLPVEQVQAFLDSTTGAKMCMKLCLQRNYPEVTDKEVDRIYNWLGEEEMLRLRNMQDGSDPLGNSTGPTADTSKTADAGGTSNGGNSSDGSPKSTDGMPPG